MLKKDKPEEVKKLKDLIQNYKVVGILNMHKLPAKQMQKIKNNLSGVAKIRMSKKVLLSKALKETDKKGMEQLIEKIKGEPALLFTNENPFKIFKELKNNRTPVAAKAGDIAAKDITIPKGSTELPPGPAISTLQKVGLKASVQAGKITVLMDRVVCKAGAQITADMVGVFSLLKIEPMEIGIELISAWEDGMIFDKDVLDISVDDYINEIKKCVQYGVNLSVNVGYPTKFTIGLMLQKAFGEARTLCIDANVVEKDFIDEILLKAIREAKSLEVKL